MPEFGRPLLEIDARQEECKCTRARNFSIEEELAELRFLKHVASKISHISRSCSRQKIFIKVDALRENIGIFKISLRI